jgi:hypothetical protein
LIRCFEKGGVSAKTLCRPFPIKKSLSKRGSLNLIILFSSQPILKIFTLFGRIFSGNLQRVPVKSALPQLNALYSSLRAPDKQENKKV